MENKIGKRAKGIAYLLMLIYFASYIMRINFAAMLATIYPAIGVTKSDISVVITGMTIFYGTGQIINGILGDRIKPKYMLTCGLLLAAACNIAMSFCTTVPVMTAVWCVNGFAHAMLWPPIVRLLSANLTDAEYSYAAVRVSWGSSFGTILIYSLCPLLLKIMDWNWIIFTLAIVGVVIAAVWVVLYPHLFNKPQTQAEGVANKASAATAVKKKGIPLPPMVWICVVLIFLGIVLQGMLRDGVTNWMPSYLLESFGMPAENAIFATVILAVFSIVSFSVFDLLHRKLIHNEVTCAAAIFVGSAVCGIVLYIINLLAASVITSMLLMAVIVACMHGINLMLITVVPKRFIKSGKVSTFSGLLNAGTYVGAAIATPVFAIFAENENLGWNFTVLMWAVIAAAGAVVCFVTVPMWRHFRKTYADVPETTEQVEEPAEEKAEAVS